MTKYSLAVKTVDLHEQMKETRRGRCAREFKEDTARQIRMNNAVTKYSLAVKTVDLHDRMRESKQERCAREFKENTDRQIRMNNAVGTVHGDSMGALIAALNTIMVKSI